MSVSKLLSAASGVGEESLDVDDVFSIDLWNGNSSTQSITNGIDLSGEGGLVWAKARNNTSDRNHVWFDTERTSSTSNAIHSNNNEASASEAGFSSFNDDGFSLSNDSSGDQNINTTGKKYCGWTFRKASKFFDIVKYTGDGNSSKTISHNLGTTVGAIFIKNVSSAADWKVFHRGLGATKALTLNATSTASTNSSFFNNTAPTTTAFTVGNSNDVNQSGQTYHAFLFAHHDDDGDFGSSGDQDIIHCGSYSGNGSTTGPKITLGFEPQWIMLKPTTLGINWLMFDIMRGWNFDNNDLFINPNNASGSAYGASTSEIDYSTTLGTEGFGHPTITDFDGGLEVQIQTPKGFEIKSPSGSVNGNGHTYIYIAIGRSTKVPTASSQVFSEHFGDGDHTTNFPVDMNINTRNQAGSINYVFNRLTHTSILRTNANDAEITNGPAGVFANSTGIVVGTNWWGTVTNALSLSWKRAQKYFDIVYYDGSGNAGFTVKHGLKVVPEMMWIKRRNGVENWVVYHSGIGETKYLQLNTTSAAITSSTHFNDTAPTDSVFTLGQTNDVNGSNTPYIAFLFATVAGVSKVGSVSHSSGSATNVDCGFSNGSKFIILKRTDSTGKWYAFSTGIGGVVAGNDTYLELNTTNVFVTSEDVVDPLSSGFQIASGTTSGTYMFYAIAA